MPPYRVYKYRSLQNDCFRHTQAILTRNTIYFAAVSSFNDPFEGHFKLVMPQSRPLAQRQYEEWANQSYNSRIRAEAAVLSLTEVRDNVLMWSHYADQHRGICIEFDANIPGSLFSQAAQVRYLNHFKCVEHGSVHGEDDLMRLVCTAKAEDWRYEYEWRVVERGAGVRSFPPECITGVILGCRISAEDRRWVYEWAERRSAPTHIYEAVQTPNAFALEIRELDSNAGQYCELTPPNPYGQADGYHAGARSRRLPP